MDFFINKPDPTRKNNKFLNSSIHKKEENLQDPQEPDLPNSQESGYSSLISSQEEENRNSNDVTNMIEKNKNSKNLCNICLKMPKNGIFNHNKIGHIYCCYSCAKQVWKKKGTCPVCNLKIKFVTKLIVV